MKQIKSLLCLFLCLLYLQISLAQYEELGQFPMRYYAPETYGGNPFVFGTALDSSGQLFIANYSTPSLLKYDGVHWEEVEVENAIVWDVAQGQDHRMYIACTDDLGYLKIDSLGYYRFESLHEKVLEQDSSLDLGQIRQVIPQANFLYFRSATCVIQYNVLNQNLKIWRPEEAHYFIRILLTSDHVFVFGDKKGAAYYDLYEVKNEELIPIQHEFLKRKLIDVLPLPSGKVLFASSKKGLYTFDGQAFTVFPTEADSLIKLNLKSAIPLSNNRYALMTNQDGGCIIDAKGKVITWLDKKQGLVSNNFLSMSYDESTNMLWIGTYDNGLVQVDVSEYFTLFNQDEAGENFYFSDLVRHQGTLYGIDGAGLPLKKLDRKQGNFSTIKISNDAAGGKIRCRESFCLFNSASWLYELSGTQTQFLPHFSSLIIQNISPALQDSSLFFISTAHGFYWVQKREGQWVLSQKALLEEYDLNSVVEATPNELWASTREGSYFRLRFQDYATLEQAEIKEYPASDDFPGGVSLKILGGQLVAGHHYYDRTSDQFELDERFPKLYDFKELDWLLKSNEVEGKIWTLINLKSGENILGVYTLQTDGTYAWNAAPLEQVFTDQLEYTQRIYAEADGVVWFAGKQVIRVDTEKNPLFPPFKAKVSKVFMNTDSLLFAGQGTPDFREIAYQNNNLNFQFAATAFPIDGALQYQSKLEGFDENWSRWSDKTERNYTNLPEGEYVFQVNAKAPNGQMSQIGNYAFEVAPPWYRTLWSFLFYALLIAASIFFLYKWIEKRLEQQNQQKLALQEAAQIQELNQLKNRFYTNITHEFRTPLTVILGMNQEKDNPKSQELIDRNGKKLLQLINQLLDLSKLDAGSLPINYEQIELVSFTQYIGESFQSLADKKFIRLMIYSEIEELWIDIDEEKYRQIISNLLSNAIKFTPESGKVILHLAQQDQQVKIKIKDNGAGIAATELPHIFDRFYQVDHTASRQGQGTGIGLALVKELIELLEGEIKVHSTTGQGTTFEILLPIKQDATLKRTVFEPIINKNGITEQIEETITGAAVSNENLPSLLLVEDNLDVIAYIQSLLKNYYQISIANDGEKGIELALAHIPDIIVSDVMMPRKNGFEVVEALKQNELTSHVPIILLTAKATQQDKLEGLKYGADAYLMKPFDKEELFIRLEQLIHIRRQLQEKYQAYTPITLAKRSASSTNLEEQFLQKLYKVIEEHFENPDFGVEELAKESQLSRIQLYRKLKAISNQTPSQFIRQFRLHQAKELLLNPEFNISEVAYQVGFNDPAYFTRVFNKAFGQSPNAYRNQRKI
ncbi:MAG: hybrid sensor histidine kinase/response regulator transcription factor [Bacteroidota bacterium]